MRRADREGSIVTTPRSSACVQGRADKILAAYCFGMPSKNQVRGDQPDGLFERESSHRVAAFKNHKTAFAALRAELRDSDAINILLTHNGESGPVIVNAPASFSPFVK